MCLGILIFGLVLITILIIFLLPPITSSSPLDELRTSEVKGSDFCFVFTLDLLIEMLDP